MGGARGEAELEGTVFVAGGGGWCEGVVRGTVWVGQRLV